MFIFRFFITFGALASLVCFVFVFSFFNVFDLFPIKTYYLMITLVKMFSDQFYFRSRSSCVICVLWLVSGDVFDLFVNSSSIQCTSFWPSLVTFSLPVAIYWILLSTLQTNNFSVNTSTTECLLRSLFSSFFVSFDPTDRVFPVVYIESFCIFRLLYIF